MFKFINNKKIIFFAILASALIPLSKVLAAIELRMQTDWPPTLAGHTLDAGSTITDLVRYIYEWGITLGGLATFIALVFAGFLYLTSAGDPGKMKDAMSRIESAFLGLVLLLASFLILQTINPELTVLRPIEFKPEDAPGADLPGTKLFEPPVPCAKAILFEEPNFTGRNFEMIPGERKGNLTFNPRSFVFCKKTEEGETKRPDDKCPGDEIEGGACTLQLFDGGWHGGFFGCSGPVAEISGPRVADIDNIMGVEKIVCLELVATVIPVAPPKIRPDYAFLSHKAFRGDHNCDTYPANCCPTNYVMCTLAGLEEYIGEEKVYGEGQGWVHHITTGECWLDMEGDWMTTAGMGTIRSHIFGKPAEKNRCNASNRVWCCPQI